MPRPRFRFLQPFALIVAIALASFALVACETQNQTEVREAEELVRLEAMASAFMDGITSEGIDSPTAVDILSTKAMLTYVRDTEDGDLIAYLSVGAYTGTDLTDYGIVAVERNKSKGRVLVEFRYADGSTAETYLGTLFIGDRGSKIWVLDSIGDGVTIYVPGDVNF